MKNAIFDLFERPHNRFKVFKNGRILYTESSGSPKQLQEELQRWLGPKNTTQTQPKDDGKNIHRLASLLCTALLAPIENSSSNPKDFSPVNTKKDSMFSSGKRKKTNVFVAMENFCNATSRCEDVKSVNAAQRISNDEICKPN